MIGAPVRGVPASENDLALVAQLRARSPKAFSDLIDRYHGPLVRLALVFVPSRALAEEVVQETWVGVLKTRGLRENRTIPFSAFADQDGDHEPAVEAARFQASGMWGVPPRRWEDVTPEKLLMTQEAMQHLEIAVSALPPNQRAVVTLRDIDGLESDEVCNVLEISETNQRVLLHRARSKLRAALEEYVERK